MKYGQVNNFLHDNSYGCTIIVRHCVSQSREQLEEHERFDIYFSTVIGEFFFYTENS